MNFEVLLIVRSGEDEPFGRWCFYVGDTCHSCRSHQFPGSEEESPLFCKVMIFAVVVKTQGKTKGQQLKGKIAS